MVWFSKTRSNWVIQVGLKLAILPPQPLELKICASIPGFIDILLMSMMALTFLGLFAGRVTLDPTLKGDSSMLSKCLPLLLGLSIQTQSLQNQGRRNQCSGTGQWPSIWEWGRRSGSVFVHETLSQKQTKANNKTLRQILQEKEHF